MVEPLKLPCPLTSHATVHSLRNHGNSLLEGRIQMQWMVAHLHWSYDPLKQRILRGTEPEGIVVGEIFFPKSYFKQTASKTCFWKLKCYVYLL